MTPKTTNVAPTDLNYDHYETEKYDQDIVASIPGHAELHQEIANEVTKFAQKEDIKNILELGIGTGLTAEIIMNIVHDASMTAMDFSEQMLEGARKRLKEAGFAVAEVKYEHFNTALIVAIK